MTLTRTVTVLERIVGTRTFEQMSGDYCRQVRLRDGERDAVWVLLPVARDEDADPAARSICA